MNESEYYAGEFSDDTLNALAEAGEFYLDESGFYEMPTQEELWKLEKMGESQLFLARYKKP
jgi:hypothetical protein